MQGKRAQGTIELSKPTDNTPWGDTAGGSPLGQRVFRLRNVVSFMLALAVPYLVYRELLGLDWREAWTSVQGANLGLFALAIVIFYCSFPLRALRWNTPLGNVGYDGTDGPPMPSTLGLTR